MRRIQWKIPLVVVIVIVCLLLSINCVACAAAQEDGGISPYYTYTNRISAGLSISDTGVAECYGELVVYELNNELTLNVRLQKQEGSVWVLVKKWTTSSNGGRFLVIDEEYSVGVGKYRVIASAVVTAPDGDIETASCTTNPRYYP